MWVTDAKGETQFVNRAYGILREMTYEQGEGGKWEVLIHPTIHRSMLGFLSALCGTHPLEGRSACPACRRRMAVGRLPRGAPLVFEGCVYGSHRSQFRHHRANEPSKRFRAVKRSFGSLRKTSAKCFGCWPQPATRRCMSALRMNRFGVGRSTASTGADGLDRRDPSR